MMNAMWKTWCGPVALCAMLAMMTMGCGNIGDEESGSSQGALAGDVLSGDLRTDDEPSDDSPRGCECSAVVEPVCGEDLNTYSNACVARCAGVEPIYEGECKEYCYCPAIDAPVCGEDGNTYPNACEARCEGVEPIYDGECREYCYCPAIDAPVCGVDGETYGNACRARCEGVEVDYEGECRDEGCNCPMVYDPVCGVDGETYGNACQARCAGVRVAYEGECRDTTPEPECRSARDCKVGGCSGQLCGSVDDDLISTCEYLPEYACYDQEYTSCGCFDGQCGWEQTEELESCIDSAGGLADSF